ncbi:MAG TPA: sensor domain-containing diguanylate cyclase [Candidatus Acidoferrales bacterium]|nr:sensor domain-containing diguanylate cyclase [Candidatus Acidoferrales bacterium]
MSEPPADRRLEQRLRELTVVNELIQTLTSTLELPEILHLVLDRLKTLTQAEALSLLLYDSERDELVFAATETLRENTVVGLRVPPQQGVSSWVARTGRSALVNNVAHDPRFYAGIDHVSHFATHSLLAVPLKQDERVVGVIEVANRYDGVTFTEDDQRTLDGLAATLSADIDPDALSHDTDAMRRLLASVAAAVPSQAASLLLYDPQGRELVFRASRTLQAGVIDGLRLRCDQGIAGWVARHREPLCLEDATKDPRYFPGIETHTHFTPRSMLCVPMLSKNTLLGVIQVINKVDGSSFNDEELRLAQTFAHHAAIAIENASLYRQAHLASITDDLTGLGNTRHFNRMLPELMRRDGPVSLLMLDLDNFKTVVDSYGHLVGSRTISYLGKIIGHLIRPGDVAARFGGDEFVVILPDTDAETALGIAETIRTAIEACSSLEGNGVDLSTITASVGVATFPDHARDADGLFKAADAAMYAVKRGGKNAVGLAESPARAGH